MRRLDGKLNGHEFDQTPGDSEGQGSLACCSTWGRKELDTTQLQNDKLDVVANRGIPVSFLEALICCTRCVTMGKFLKLPKLQI